MKKKKLVSLVLAGALAASTMLTGCGTDSADSGSGESASQNEQSGETQEAGKEKGEKITITYWHIFPEGDGFLCSIMIRLVPVSTFDTCKGDSLYEIILETEEQCQCRQSHHHGSCHKQIPLYPRISLESPQSQCYRVLLRLCQIDQRTKEVVPGTHK